jgi:dephospho-CoA kinase
MRALVFKDPKQRAILEKILHPKIREVVQQRLEQGAPNYFLIVVPLLFEKGGWGELMDEVIVVDCPVDQQVARVIQRNGWPEAQVRAVIGNQADREVRLAGADYVVENTGDIPELIEKIDFLHQKLIKNA